MNRFKSWTSQLFLLVTLCQDKDVYSFDIAADWSYNGENGVAPEDWPHDGIDYFCRGKNQSPIDIIHATTEPVSYEPFNFKGYRLDEENYGSPIKVKNNGHGGFITFDDNYVLTGGGLDKEYRAAQLHFHWGADHTLGSEHEIDSETFTAELHIVHYDTDYDSPGAALADTEVAHHGLAVLGILLTVQDEHNEKFDNVFEAFTTVVQEDQETSIVEENLFNVADLLPNDMSRFYRYNGSLTTPSCHEVVIWTVFEDVVGVSENQLDYLRNLTLHTLNGTHETVLYNHRPTQALNRRTVLYNASERLRLNETSFILLLIMAFSYLFEFK